MLNKTIRLVVLIILSSRIFFLFSAIAASLFLPVRPGYLGSGLNPNDSPLFWIWANFDGQHYLKIAISGYNQLLSQGRFDFAFFPLYPLLISLLHQVTLLPYLYSGIFTSTIFYLLSMVMVYKIIKLDYDRHIALLTLFFLSFFPLSFFYHSVYTDSLFLFLTTSSFYFARKKNWLLAGLFGAFATFDRLSGLALLPALLLEWYLQRKKSTPQNIFSLPAFIKQLLPALLLTSAGFFLYISYLQINFGDWSLFQKSMIAWKQEQFIFPLQVSYRYLKIFISVSPRLLEYWVAVLEFTSFILYIFLSIYVWKKIRSSYGLFMIVILILITFTGTLNGSPRYTLHLFPGFLGLALLTNKNNLFLVFIVIFFISLGIALTGLFTRGYFVS